MHDELRDLDLPHQFSDLDELRRARGRVGFELVSRRPGVGVIVMTHVAEEQARTRAVDDQPDLLVDPDRPEVLVPGAVQLVELHPGARGVELEIEGGGLDGLLLGAGELGEAGGEGVGNAEVHGVVAIGQAVLGGLVRSASALRFASPDFFGFRRRFFRNGVISIYGNRRCGGDSSQREQCRHTDRRQKIRFVHACARQARQALACEGNQIGHSIVPCELPQWDDRGLSHRIMTNHNYIGRPTGLMTWLGGNR